MQEAVLDDSILTLGVAPGQYQQVTRLASRTEKGFHDTSVQHLFL